MLSVDLVSLLLVCETAEKIAVHSRDCRCDSSRRTGHCGSSSSSSDGRRDICSGRGTALCSSLTEGVKLGGRVHNHVSLTIVALGRDTRRLLGTGTQIHDGDRG